MNALKLFAKKLGCTLIYGTMMSGMLWGGLHIMLDYMKSMDLADEEYNAEKRRHLK